VRCIKQYDVLTTIAVLNDPAFSGIANLSTSTVLLVVSPHVLLEPKILNASSHFVYLTPKRPHDAPATASDASRLRLSWETILLVLCRICYVKRAKPSHSFVSMKHSKQLQGRQAYPLFVPHLSHCNRRWNSLSLVHLEILQRMHRSHRLLVQSCRWIW
jgi:hypothetical protein